MSRATAEYFRLLKLGPLELDTVGTESQSKIFPTVPDYVVSFEVDESHPGRTDFSQRIPLAQQAEQDKILDAYEAAGIIEKVPPHEHPKYVSPQFFVARDDGRLRLVNDNKYVNKAIKIVVYPMATLEDILPDLAGATHYSITDIKDAFLHLPLDEKSKRLTTFFTRHGLRRYTRLSFGINTAPTIFQQYMDTAFADLEGTRIFMDDILTFGKTYDECKKRTDAVLARCAKLNLTLNEKKLQTCKESVTFLGMRLDKNGKSPNQ